MLPFSSRLSGSALHLSSKWGKTLIGDEPFSVFSILAGNEACVLPELIESEDWALLGFLSEMRASTLKGKACFFHPHATSGVLPTGISVLLSSCSLGLVPAWSEFIVSG